MGQIRFTTVSRSLLYAACGALLAASAALAEGPLRVGTSGDYAPFSHASPEAESGLAGFDIAVATAYARDRGRGLSWVRFRWPGLLADLAAGHFDVVMSGVTVRPERSVAGRFSVPVVSSGAVVLVADPDRFPSVARVDAPGVRVAVNAGGHLERVARVALPRATILALPDNRAVPGRLARGEVEAIVSDTLEAPGWISAHPGFTAHPPITRDRKAYLLPANAGTLARDLDDWLLARERDGTLSALRAAWLGASGEPIAQALPALLASLDERLDLMPLVAEAKRGSGTPVAVPEREAEVVAAAVAGTRRAARAAGLPAPEESAVEALFRAQIEAAKTVQRAALAGPAASGEAPDLAGELRPALGRIGNRITWLVVRLPRGVPAATVRGGVAEVLDTRGLGSAGDAIADALVALTR